MFDWLINTVQSQLENQFFSGGALLVIFTAALALLRNAPKQLWDLFQRRFITTVDISDHDPAFFWVQKWLGEQPYTKDKARLLTASTRSMPVKAPGPEEPSVSLGRKRILTEVVFSPAPGYHLIRFNGHFILLNRIRREGESISGDISYHERFELRTFSREVIQKLIYEARETAFPPEDNRVAIMKPNYSSWRIAQRRPPRPLDSVVLSGSMMEELRDDLSKFFVSKDWYIEHGIPYQRGYLLYGDPGGGKSSAVVALASHFDRDIYIINLTSVSDNQLSHLMSELPEHAMLLIEDVDCVYQERKRVEGHELLTFSGFINAIDGVCAPTGRVLFMTTNHPERLDAALVRPGRIDRKFKFKNADVDMARRLYERFFPGEIELAKTFGQLVGGSSREFSMADLQEHLIAFQGDPHGAAHRLPDHKPARIRTELQHTNGAGHHPAE